MNSYRIRRAGEGEGGKMRRPKLVKQLPRLPAGCVRCMTAFERIQHVFSEATKLGLDYPTDTMLENMVRDAEWNALWNPREIAEQHDQSLKDMCRIWRDALAKVKEFNQ
jgi:hypothetical protein